MITVFFAMEQVLLALIDKLPVTFVVMGCVGWTVHKICISDKGTFTKLVRYLDKKFKHSSEESKGHFKKLEERMEKLEKSDREQNEFLNMLLGEKGEK